MYTASFQVRYLPLSHVRNLLLLLSCLFFLFKGLVGLALTSPGYHVMSRDTWVRSSGESIYDVNIFFGFCPPPPSLSAKSSLFVRKFAEFLNPPFCVDVIYGSPPGGFSAWDYDEIHLPLEFQTHGRNCGKGHHMGHVLTWMNG